MNVIKEKIVKLFNNNVRDKIPNVKSSNSKHSGKYGHWLEAQMGIARNSDNKPDLLGYEMKNKTTSGKISFGDWSADEYIFISDSPINDINKKFQFSKKDFLKTFGKANPNKGGRYSWSGIPCPTYYNQTSEYGQKLTIDSSDNVVIIYNYLDDKRKDKETLVPIEMQKENLILVRWKKETLKKKLEDKFNQNGWFTCSTDKTRKYNGIHFGEPMNFDSWIKLFKDRKIFFDSGMYDGNIRPYSMWRATTGVWNNLITESY